MRTQLLLLTILLAGQLAAQQPAPPPDFDPDAFIQSLFPVQDAEFDYSQAYESLLQRYSAPLDLNSAGRDELQSLYILSDQQITSLLKHIDKNGKLLSLYELQAVEGFDPGTISRVLPFVKVAPATAPGSLWQRIQQEKNTFLLMRYERGLEPKKGYRQDTAGTRYAGAPDELLVRFRSSHSRDFSFGFTLEKDAGEPLLRDRRNGRQGFDFMSAHAAVYNRKRLRSLVIGDYQLQAGQGLLLSGGFAFGKGGETVLTTRRSGTGIRPYTSVVESGFFRGMAASFSAGQKAELMTFVSSARRDATGTDTAVSSLPQAGLHRTDAEVATRKQVGERVAGAHLRYQPRYNLQLGLTLVYTCYDDVLIPRKRNYNQFDFRGKENYNIGMNYSYVWRNVNLFGEMARSASGGIGVVAGLNAALSAKLEMALLWRRYDRNFHSFYGAAFGESVRNSNEQGTYAGIKFKPNPRWQFSAFCDRFAFGWLKYRVNAPSEGYECLGRVSYQPSRKVVLYVQARQKMKEKNMDEAASPMVGVVPSLKNNFLFNLDYRAEKHLLLRSRVQAGNYRQQGGKITKGYTIVQDVAFEGERMRLTTRFALFDTDDFENRQYVFENDLWGTFSFPAYYGKGFRNYYLLQLRLGRSLDCWLRYAYTLYRDREKAGTGLEEIEGNRRSEVKVQVRWRMGVK